MELKPATVDKEDVLMYDLGNLSTFDSAPIDTKEFGQNPRAFLESLARDNTQLLVNHIFELPSEPEPSGQGRLAELPDPVAKIPRTKPVPKPKPMTKWQEFALAKGIEKRKRSRMVFDEDKQEYAPRHGYKRARKDTDQWVVEAKPGEDASVDPWTRMEQDKKERVAKNKKQQLNNLKAAACSNNRVPGAIDLTSAVGETKPGKRNQEGKKKSKHHVDVALEVAQKSTASMGKFDKQRAREPEMKAERKPRRDAELERSVEAEKKQSLAVLNRILGKAAEAEKFNVEKEMGIRQVFQETESRKAKEAKAAAAAAKKAGGSSKGSAKGSAKGGKGSAKGKGSKGKR